MRVVQCVPAVRAVDVSVFACIRSRCVYVTEVGGPSDLWESRKKLLCIVTGICIIVPYVSFSLFRSSDLSCNADPI